jgi:hypothetical protein
VIRHPTERVQSSVLLFEHLRNDLIQLIPIHLAPEQASR